MHSQRRILRSQSNVRSHPIMMMMIDPNSNSHSITNQKMEEDPPATTTTMTRRRRSTSSRCVELSVAAAAATVPAVMVTPDKNMKKETVALSGTPARRSVKRQRRIVTFQDPQEDQNGVIGSDSNKGATTRINKKTVNDKTTKVSTSTTPKATTAKNQNQKTSAADGKAADGKATDGKAKTLSETRAVVTPTPTPTRAAPDGWQDTYALIQELRADRTAPCDHSGCEALAHEAANDNHHHYLKRVGFRQRKTQFIQDICPLLLEHYDGDIPPTADLMMQQLPGIGPKMAYLIENVAWNRYSGIGVDTHMHRIVHQLGWVTTTSQRTATAEHTRIQLQQWLPVEYWPDVNALFVGFGQEVQQFPAKILRKALHHCSRPSDAVPLLQQCGMNVPKVAEKHNIELLLLNNNKNENENENGSVDEINQAVLEKKASK